MNLHLKNVIPVPLAGISFNPQSVWMNDVSLSSGNNYLIFAPSGTGKSTLISVLYGTRNDFTGDVFINEKNTRSMSLKYWSELRQQSLSVIFQDLRLFPQLTVLENIELKAKLTNVVTRDEISAMAEKLGIAIKLNVPCKILSLGQQQRVAIISALVQPFKFLLMDEPFSHLDQKNIELASELIDEACKKNDAGIILTSLGEKYLFSYQSVLTI